ncbi:hypothetical protein B6A27_05210 [Anoxybacillus sp. UARK-01]|uniref:DUF2777 family protein n=1 Tax=Anoxybacillus sp. UARK-01 TaxID=1895648 RepID=UPI0009B932C8|nr:DUF2777 family protein [Anoxybacillus sp. UARK-01]OQM46560.1 hypothetical protein B6A27_05210 [Anoxybacillus sp. UARK-01]
MTLEQKLAQIPAQQRAYIQGEIEYVNGEWVFFDEEEEEAGLLAEWSDEEIEIFRFGRWLRGYYQHNGEIQLSGTRVLLQNGELVRFRKRLPYAYRSWLDALPEKTFFGFIEWLNKLNFSLYDCLYCYNGLLFEKRTGVNFMIFDNTELIGNVQHYYERGETNKDRFEMTFHTGNRFICTQIS